MRLEDSEWYQGKIAKRRKEEEAAQLRNRNKKQKAAKQKEQEARFEKARHGPLARRLSADYDYYYNMAMRLEQTPVPNHMKAQKRRYLLALAQALRAKLEVLDMLQGPTGRRAPRTNQNKTAWILAQRGQTLHPAPRAPTTRRYSE